MLAAKLDITAPGPGYIHFPLNPEAGFDLEFSSSCFLKGASDACVMGL
jgi:hypothetical protein